MSSLRKGKADSWAVRTRRNYYEAVEHLGISTRGLNRAVLMEVVMCVARQKEKSLQKAYEDVANRLGVESESIEKEIQETLDQASMEHRSKYGELQAPALREFYLGDEYAEIREPQTFILKIAHYIQTQR